MHFKNYINIWKTYLPPTLQIKRWEMQKIKLFTQHHVFNKQGEWTYSYFAQVLMVYIFISFNFQIQHQGF